MSKSRSGFGTGFIIITRQSLNPSSQLPNEILKPSFLGFQMEQNLELSNQLLKQVLSTNQLPDKLIQQLKDAAESAKQFSYSPYSKFRVGAALLTKQGQIILGCNVENASYGGTICAERTAFVKAIVALLIVKRDHRIYRHCSDYRCR